MPDLVPVRRALISVSDKTGLVDTARALAGCDIELISTGGTRAAIEAAGLPVKDVSLITEYPEMMDGRVKTLHPRVHGGLLADRDDPAHRAAMEVHNIEAIDLLIVNLYPFENTLAAQGDFDACIADIDIGGPAMIRAAAKNHAHVAVCVDGEDVALVLEEMETHAGSTSLALRRRLAAKAYARTAAYDAAISGWFAEKVGEPYGGFAAFGGGRTLELRYGENPHQAGAFYAFAAPRPGVAAAEQVQGKDLSYNNLNDTDAAFELVAEFDPDEAAAIAIIKHANPCGVALGESLLEAHAAALACDPVSAFGGVIAANRPLDGPAAEAIVRVFTEVVIAPGADDAALEVFAAKKNLRLLLTDGLPDPTQPGRTARSLSAGMLVQDRDAARITAADLKTVTKRAPSAEELRDLIFAWRVAKHVKSNAIVYAKDGSTAGVGAGQMSRVDSARIAARKAEDAAEAAGWSEPRTKGSVVASDAFFPFSDGLRHAVAAGARAVIQPGGSIRDDEVIAAADEADVAMVFTGVRHFRH